MYLTADNAAREGRVHEPRADEASEDVDFCSRAVLPPSYSLRGLPLSSSSQITVNSEAATFDSPADDLLPAQPPADRVKVNRYDFSFIAFTGYAMLSVLLRAAVFQLLAIKKKTQQPFTLTPH